MIGDLPGPVIDEVTRLWEQSLQILERVLRRGVDSGELRACDTWAVANIMWTVANSIIQSEGTLARRDLRKRPLDEVFRTAIGTLLRGLVSSPESAPPPPPSA